MASSINASTTAGVVTTADTSGVLNIQTAGTTALTVDTTANVGIGTTSPAQTLHVKTSTSATPITLGVLSNATGLPALSFNGAYASTTMAGIYGNGATASSLYYEVPSGQSHFFGIADATKITINSSGNLKAIGTISVGDATPSASGAGITFPATQSASTNANTLDDYEEGTWTPTFNSSGTAIVASYNNTNGSYTKIGNMVTVYGYIAVASVSSATGSYLRISGLPFNCASSSGIGTGNAGGIPAGSSCVYQGFTSLSSGDVIALGAVESVTSEINLWKMNGNGSFGTGMSGANVTAGTLIYFTVTYRAA